MEPLTTAALILGAGKLIGGVGQGIANIQRTAPNEALLDEIARLERLQEADALGLTGTERAAFTDAFVNPQRALAEQQMEQSQALQAMSQDSGEQLRRLRAQEEQGQRALAESNRQVELLNQQQAESQRQALLQMQIAEEQRQADRAAAITQTVSAGLAGAANIGAGMISMNELAASGAGAYDAASLQRLGSMYGYAFPQYQQPIGQPFNLPPGAVQQGMFMLPPAYYGMATQPGMIPGTPMATPQAQQGTGEE
tara:strand:+ start:15072 stop:15833 length:762 start_codon:yes stop_codon:yes gene_type:complete